MARAHHDPEAFAVLFRRHVDEVHRFVARRVGDGAVADDLTAIVFERCWGVMPALELRQPSLLPLLMRIASNVLATHFRSEGRRVRREQLAVVRDAPRHHEVELEPVDAGLLAALGELSARSQEVLVLRFLADLTTEETARALGVTRGHAAVLQYRALGELRHRWTRRRTDATS